MGLQISKHIWCFLAVMTLLPQCSARRAPDSGSNSNISSLSFALPPNKDDKGNILFDAYSIELTTTNPNCKDYEIATMEPSTNLEIKDLELKNLCDYFLVLNLGFSKDFTTKGIANSALPKGNKKVLSKPTYSNSKNPTQGTPIKAQELSNAPNRKLSIQILVYRMTGSGPDTLQTPDVTNLDITVKFGEGNNANPQNSELSANTIHTPTNDSELQNLISANKNRRFIVQFSADACSGCKTQLDKSREIAGSLNPSNKTIFIYYDYADSMGTIKQNRDPNIWSLAPGPFPKTLVFENGKLTNQLSYDVISMNGFAKLQALAREL